ncbi:MAG: hypothetical protein JJT78_15540 [Leptospira sp.]|nr:hypothetical protein [Leptospira sp.]
MKVSEYQYNPERIVTLIRQTIKTRNIWSVEVTTNAWVENVFQSNPGYKWEVDCDLDTYLLWQNEIESEDMDREISKRSEKSWVNYPELPKVRLENWLDQAFAALQASHKSGEYPYDDLIPIIAQDRDGKILMQAWGNRSAIVAGWDTGLGNYFSRSRNKFWTKGEESGHTQSIFAWTLEEKFPYTVIYHVDQKGAACHTGEYSCFFREMKIWNDPGLVPR